MLFLVRVWILLSALLVGAGWLLSALHQLNRAGYGVTVALAVVAAGFFRPKGGWVPVEIRQRGLIKFSHRFRKPAPFFFLVLAVFAFLGGAIYRPDSSDSDAYRIPRVLHWLAAGHWYWIHTLDSRMNIVGCGFEWLSAPLILFTHTDRLLFLINWICFLMLPGLTYGVLVYLRVTRRAAWWWMWILASGWCYILQAGSFLNDSFGVIYALAAIYFALRAQKYASFADLCYSCLAAALMTGVKQTNIPLILLWAVVFWPGTRLFFSRPVKAIGTATAALLVSALPLVAFNFQYTGTWMGIDKTPGLRSLVNASELDSPGWGIIGNLFCIPAQNLMPPFFPWADKWNALMGHFLTTPFGSHFSSFERFGYLGNGAHGVDSATAGIGLGISLLTVISVAFARACPARFPMVTSAKNPAVIRLALLVPWGLLIIFMAKNGAFTNARHLAAYYIFFFPVLLAGPGQEFLTRLRWWRWTSLSVMLLSILILFASRSEPLFPALTVFHRLEAAFPHASIINRAAFAFESRTVQDREERWLADNLPAAQHVVGYTTSFGALDAFIWRPYGQRRVERVLPADSPESLLAQDIHYVVVDNPGPDQTISSWILRYHGALVSTLALAPKVDTPPSYTYLVRLNDP